MRTKWTKDSLIEYEGKLAKMFEEGKINCPLHLCGGNEQELLSIFSQVQEKDWVFSTHRAHYHYLLKGGVEEKLTAEVLGGADGMCGGVGRSMHLYDKSINFYTSAIVAGNVAMAVGVAMAIKQTSNQVDRNNWPHVWCFVGDGAEDSGWFVEAVRLANGRELPITFIVEDNDFSIDVDKKTRWHNYSPVDSVGVIRYHYEREWPHVGIGKMVMF